MGSDKLHSQIQTTEDLINARRAARHFAVRVGFAPHDCIVIAAVVSELARNILKRVGSGEMTLTELDEGGIAVLAEDEGAGIPEPSNVFRPGRGLWAVRKGMDELVIGLGENGRGTRVKATKRLWGKRGQGSSHNGAADLAFRHDADAGGDRSDEL